MLSLKRLAEFVFNSLLSNVNGSEPCGLRSQLNASKQAGSLASQHPLAVFI